MAHFVVVAGEPSGDLLGAKLISDLKKLNPDHKFSGITGPEMVAEGCESWFDISDLSVMGLTEVVKHLPRILKIRKRVIDQVLSLKPDAYIGIDYPEFNLSIERKIKKQNIKTIQMVCPSFWAWRESRAKKFYSAVDLMLCLFPFEPELLNDKGVNARFIGHPLAEKIAIEQTNTLSSSNQKINIALLPGSRKSEIEFHLSTMLDSALMIQKELESESKKCIFNIPTRFSDIDERIQSQKKYSNLNYYIQSDSGKCISESDLVIAKSGTSTLESALYKKPTIVVYKMSSLSFFLIKRFNLVSVKYASLPNILLGYEYFKEFLQKDFNAKNISDEALRLLYNTSNDYSDPLIDLHLKLLAPDETNVATEIASFLER